mgnify:CR=1 FL=1
MLTWSGPCDCAVSANGDLFVADGYGNHKVHRFTPEGELLHSWGEDGDGPGQFTMVHGVRIDKYDRLWVCDRENRRIQIFDTDGKFLEERVDLERPDQVYFDPNEDIVYIAELEYRVTIQTLDGETVADVRVVYGGMAATPRRALFISVSMCLKPSPRLPIRCAEARSKLSDAVTEP